MDYKSRWDDEDKRAKTLWDFKFQTNQADTVVVDKEQKRAAIIDMIQLTATSKRKSTKRSRKTPKLGERLQQIPGTTSEVSVQEWEVLLVPQEFYLHA